MTYLFSRIFIVGILLMSLTSSIYSVDQPNGQNGQKIAVTPVPPLPDLLEQASRLSKKAFDLNSDSALTFDTNMTLTNLERINQRTDSLKVELEQLKNGDESLDEQVYILRSSLKNENALIKKQIDPVLETLEELHDQSQFWLNQQQLWKSWYDEVLKGNSATSLREVMRSTMEEIKGAIDAITEKSDELIQTMQKASSMQSDIFQMEQRIEQRIKNLDSVFPAGNLTPLFTPAFFNQLSADGWKGITQGFYENALPDWQLLKSNARFIFLQIFSIILVTFFLLTIRSESSVELLAFLQRPFSTAIFVCLLFLRVLEPVSPPVWMLLESAVAWIAFLRLFSLYASDRGQTVFMYAFAAIHLLIQLLLVVKVPFAITRLFIFFTSVGASAALFLYSRSDLRTKNVKWCLGALSVLFGMIAFVELAGFSDMSKTLFKYTISTLNVFVKAWLLFHISWGMVEWSLQWLSSDEKYLVKERVPILSKISRIALYLFFATCILIYLLVGWGVFDSANEAFSKVLSSGVSLGNIQFSLSDILQAILLAVVTLVVSVAIQSVLNQSVFPSMNIPKDVGFSIARLIHYFILSVGLLLVLLSLGVSFTNLAIFGGALGVGLGMGLQEIVKNFAAGIIILVERPIKIGDLIEFENTTCRVEKIGLRSTLVRALDGILKVIPNNDLIVNPVTNWTHSRKRLRKSSMIGVAYGSDVDLTIRLLKEAAESHDSVLKNPEPEVFFEEFGDSALIFELRYWVKDVSLIKVVPSEINQLIERKLAEANIEIPYPQMDVHFYDTAKVTQ